MENALLIVHLVLVIFLIAIVLLQRSEGGALGMGGGGGGVMTGRGAATALQKVTWWVAGGFIATSLILTIIATTKRQERSVFDTPAAAVEEPVSEDGTPLAVPPTIDGSGELSLPKLDGLDALVPATPQTAPAGDPDSLVPAPNGSQN